MDQTHYLDPRSSQELITLFKSSRLIPFFGSGFTKGEDSKKGKVPDANGLTRLITSTAAGMQGLAAEQVDQLKKISSLKTAFGLLGMDKYISQKSAQTLLVNTFSEVGLSSKNKRDLLSIDWPHIFTFNIDDAIERHSSGLKLLQPNKSTSREYIAAHRCLFKIHGDIAECASNDDINLIFTWRDYSRSIASNKAMLSFLSDESKNSAFLFIGCSLDAELDLINLSKETPLKKSVFLKKGPLSIEDEISLKEYGLSRVIYFDDYDQIYQWVCGVLGNVKRESAVREIEFNQSSLAEAEAKQLFSNGGPLYKIEKQTRVARASSTFAQRALLDDACAKIRRVECLLVTGRRFSGKTLFLFQLMLSLQEYSVKFFGSSDPYNPIIKRQLESLENHLFVFDSNHLDSVSLDDVLRAKMVPSSKLVICASFGDAERIRFKLSDRRIEFEEVQVHYALKGPEVDDFNKRLASSGLPLTLGGESLVDYAFRCHEEYKASLPKSNLFDRTFKEGTYLVLMMLVAFGKAKQDQINCIFDGFDLDAFVKVNDRVFDIETTSTGERVLVCSASAWLLKVMHTFVRDNRHAHETVSKLIRLLEGGGYSALAKELIRIDKINEISGGHRSRIFIKRIYEDISDLYSRESHYWLQRAKAELISAQVISELNEGVGYAQKVRLDNSREKTQTYYSATLVLVQIYAKAYKLTGDKVYLSRFIDPCTESIHNYQNNRRHVNELIDVVDVLSAVDDLRTAVSIEFLPDREKIKEVLGFFDQNADKGAKRGRRRHKH